MPPNPQRDVNCLNKFKKTVRETIQNMTQFFSRKKQQAQAALQNVNAPGFDFNAGRDSGVDQPRRNETGLPSYTESMNPLQGLPKYSERNEGPHLPAYDFIDEVWDGEQQFTIASGEEWEPIVRIDSVGSLTREEIENQTQAWAQLAREQNLEGRESGLVERRMRERERVERGRVLEERGGYFENLGERVLRSEVREIEQRVSALEQVGAYADDRRGAGENRVSGLRRWWV
jgi:hypothetical protein